METKKIIQLATRGATATSCVLALNGSYFGKQNEPVSVAVPIGISEAKGFWVNAESQITTSQNAAPTDVLAERFYSLVKKWKNETGHFSVIARRYENPAYKAILDMRESAIPMILNELKRNPDRWFSALEKLTGENPAKDAVNFYEAVDRWVAWGIANEYIV
ncbi:MAG: hypothetical protein ABSG80_15185 [Verrucomicrobiota bacterium]|jgi:hypothetical protein